MSTHKTRVQITARTHPRLVTLTDTSQVLVKQQILSPLLLSLSSIWQRASVRLGQGCHRTRISDPLLWQGTIALARGGGGFSRELQTKDCNEDTLRVSLTRWGWAELRTHWKVLETPGPQTNSSTWAHTSKHLHTRWVWQIAVHSQLPQSLKKRQRSVALCGVSDFLSSPLLSSSCYYNWFHLKLFFSVRVCACECGLWLEPKGYQVHWGWDHKWLWGIECECWDPP